MARGKWGWVVVAASLVASCGDGGGDAGKATIGAAASLELSRGGAPIPFDGVLLVSPGSNDAGAVEVLTVLNTGNADLLITELSVASTPPWALAVAAADGGALPVAITVSPGERGAYAFRLVYAPPADPSAAVAGVITFRWNAVRGGEAAPVLRLDVVVDEQLPGLQVAPTEVDLGAVQQGTRGERSLLVLNVGRGTLVVDRVALGGHPGFSVAVGGEVIQASDPASAAGRDLATPLTVAPGASATIAVRFDATGPEPAEGALTLHSNVALAGGTVVVPLAANVGGPCLILEPRRLDFGGRRVGGRFTAPVTLTSCGDEDLVVSAIDLVAGGSLDFEVVAGGGAPLTLAPGESATFEVAHTPAAVAGLDADGDPVLEHAEVSVVSNANVREQRLEVTGWGVAAACPVAVIAVGEGDDVIPQTTLHLDGTQSYSAGHTITRYRWEVVQPIGSRSLLTPGAEAERPTFEANVAGTYRFRLQVTDSAGTVSCVVAEQVVTVTSTVAVHIELLWRTPGDLDETDTGPEAGADLDLHFAHPSADSGHDGDGDGISDPWFDFEGDTFWFRKKHDWGVAGDASDDPSLDRDDRDGAGPENVNLNGPEDGQAYPIAVHYWAARGFGPSYATVRVYAFGSLVFEAPEVALSYDDLWTVGRLSWPSGQVTLAKVCSGTTTPCTGDASCGGASCGLRIAPNYDNAALPN